MKEQLKEYLKAKELKEDYNSEYQNRIREYIIANASPELSEKILASKKNIPDCFLFVLNTIQEEYVKLKGRTSGGYAVPDAKVYGLAIHYFEEDEIEAGTTTESTHSETIPTESFKKETTTQVEKEPKNVSTKVEKMSKKEKDLEKQYGGLTLFD